MCCNRSSYCHILKMFLFWRDFLQARTCSYARELPRSWELRLNFKPPTGRVAARVPTLNHIGKSRRGQVLLRQGLITSRILEYLYWIFVPDCVVFCSSSPSLPRLHFLERNHGHGSYFQTIHFHVHFLCIPRTEMGMKVVPPSRHWFFQCFHCRIFHFRRAPPGPLFTPFKLPYRP